ncbi:lytic transglycosylase domain-containing protein [Nocardioides sp.]|uniref:aggregation-promoting factor C-terminal-like domain-containing protein n=1 Tax=Nocardioides sp. TaxID=35761 RepID=UPI00286B0E8E|nr:lytic transglycosylase domain-containing protein [Nocardioides sp.]
MSKHAKHVPQHRAPVQRPGAALVEAPRKALRTTLILSSVAVAATGATVSAGLLTQSPAVSASADDLAVDPNVLSSTTDDVAEVDDAPQSSLSEAGLARRSAEVSRSSRRQELAPAAGKEAELLQSEGTTLTRTEDLSDNDPRDIGRALLAELGFSSDQFGCLDSLWTRESGWNVYADNPSSSAYGIPQSLPGSKMASAGADWATNPVTQIRWGLGYIQDRYGSPCGAWAHSESNGWY